MNTAFVIVALFCSLNPSRGQSNDIENLEKRLDIVRIEESPYDIDLRIFLARGFTNGGHVLWIRKMGEEWSGTKFDYFSKIKNNGELGKIKEIKTNNLTPEGSWANLWSDLKKSNISNLPNQDDIQHKLRKEVTTKRGKGYEIIQVMDGSGYNLILKEDENIIKYSFHSPWEYAEKFPEVEEVNNYSEIISKLEDQFNIEFRN